MSLAAISLPVFVDLNKYVEINHLSLEEFENLQNSVSRMKIDLWEIFPLEHIEIQISGLYGCMFANQMDQVEINLVIEIGSDRKSKLIRSLISENDPNIEKHLRASCQQGLVLFSKHLDREVAIFWNYLSTENSLNQLLSLYRKHSELPYLLVNIIRSFDQCHHSVLNELGFDYWHIICLVVFYLQLEGMMPFLSINSTVNHSSLDKFQIPNDCISIFKNMIRFYLNDFDCSKNIIDIADFSNQVCMTPPKENKLHILHPIKKKIYSVLTYSAFESFTNFLNHCYQHCSSKNVNKQFYLKNSSDIKFPPPIISSIQELICDKDENISSIVIDKPIKSPLASSKQTKICSDNAEFEDNKEYFVTKNYHSTPKSLVEKSGIFLQGKVDHFLMDLVETSRTPSAKFSPVVDFLAELEKELEKVISNCFILPYGSCTNGLALLDAEIDCTFVSPNENGHLPENHIEIVANCLKQLSFIQRFEITGGRFGQNEFRLQPKNSKFTYNLSFGMKFGVVNSLMIKYLCHISPLFRHLCVLLKFTIKRYDPNPDTQRYLRSYELNILVLHYLQRCNPPILPDLKDFKTNGCDLFGINSVYFPSEATIHKWKKEGKLNKKTLKNHWIALLAYLKKWLKTYHHMICVNSDDKITHANPTSHYIMDFASKQNIALRNDKQSLNRLLHIIQYVLLLFTVLPGENKKLKTGNEFELMMNRYFKKTSVNDLEKIIPTFKN